MIERRLIRRASATGRAARARTATPAPATARTKSRPIEVVHGAALDTVNLSKEVPRARPRDESAPGIHVIPLDSAPDPAPIEELSPDELEDTDQHELVSSVLIEVEPPDAIPALDALPPDELTELDLADIEEIPLGAPRALAAARHALAATPLFAGLSSDARGAGRPPRAGGARAGRGPVPRGRAGRRALRDRRGRGLVLGPDAPRTETHCLGPGAFLGEVALLTEQPRTATVAAATLAELLRIDRAVTLSNVLAARRHAARGAAVRARSAGRALDEHEPAVPSVRRRAARRARGAVRAPRDRAGCRSSWARGCAPTGSTSCSRAGSRCAARGRVVATLGPGDLTANGAALGRPVPQRRDRARQGAGAVLAGGGVPRGHHDPPAVLEYRRAEHSRRLHILLTLLGGAALLLRRRRRQLIDRHVHAGRLLLGRLGAGPEQAAERVPAERGGDQRGAEQQVDDADQPGCCGPSRTAPCAAARAPSSSWDPERQAEAMDPVDDDEDRRRQRVSQTGIRMGRYGVPCRDRARSGGAAGGGPVARSCRAAPGPGRRRGPESAVTIDIRGAGEPECAKSRRRPDASTAGSKNSAAFWVTSTAP